MKNFTFLLCASSLLALTACDEPRSSATSLPPGQYERSTKSTDEYGTTTKRDTTTNVTVDQYGNKRAVVEKKTTKDPRGLFNKRTSETREVIEER